MVRLQDDIAQLVICRALKAYVEGQPLKEWRRTPELVTKVWQLEDADNEKPLSSLEEDTTAVVIDICPHGERHSV